MAECESSLRVACMGNVATRTLVAQPGYCRENADVSSKFTDASVGSLQSSLS
jgi:hypothetical protein